MMRNTFTALLAACTLGMPSVAAAQAPPASGPDARARISAEVIVDQTRERTRVVQRRRDNRAEQTERVSHTFKIGGSGELQVSNLSGDITITRGGGSEVRVEAIKTARAATEDLARETLAAMRVDFAERGGRAEVKVLYPREFFGGSHRNVSGSVAYNITAPEGTRIGVKSLSGSIRVTGIKGDLSLVSTSGDVGAFAASRLSLARSTSGNVEVGELRTDMPAELRSVSGDIIVRQSRAPRLELNTVSGRVVVENVRAERIDARSISGDLQFAAVLDTRGRYDLNSHSGNIRIAIVGDGGFELDANSFSGSIRSDVELTEQSRGESDSHRNRRAHRLRGVYGDGSALLDVTTFSGDVIISKK